MPYTDIQNQNHEDILYIFTTSIINGRFDILNTDTKTSEDKYQTSDSGLHSLFYNFNVSDPKNVNNITNDPYYYTSYGTYRRDITGEEEILKKSETLVPNILYNNAYYNITKYDKDNNKHALERLFNFKGIALNYAYPCNGHAASLEDIFAEYGYDFIVAQEQQRFQNSEPYYYFQETQSYSTQFTYEIMPIGTVYTDEETGEIVTVEYDGTTVPTAQQIISGNLYIAIRSGSMPIRRIYFNNQYMPTLFVNDDKYNLKLTMNDKYKETSYQYILNNNQIMKLCDVTRYKSYGYYLTFTNTFLIYEGKNLPFGGGWSFPKPEDNFLYQYLSQGNDHIIDSITIEKNIPGKSTLGDFDFGISFRVFAILYTHSIDKIRWFEGDDSNTPAELKRNNITLNASYVYELSYSQHRQQYTIDSSDNIKKQYDIFKPYKLGGENQYYIDDSAYIFNNKSTSSVPEGRSDLEITELQVCAIPCLYFNGFTVQNTIVQPAPISSTHKENKITLSYSSQENARAEILLTPINLTLNKDNLVYSTNSGGQNILGLSNGDNISESISNNVHTSTYTVGTIPSPTLTIQGKNIINNDTSYSGIWYNIAKIGFQELTEYRLSDNIIKYNLAELKLDITLSGRQATCGFFTENADYDPVFMEEVEYEPVFLEWVDDYEPVFIVLD